MRRVRVKYYPSLEEGVEDQLDQALQDEKEKEAATNSELKTPLDNTDGFTNSDTPPSAPVEDEISIDVPEKTPAESAAESTSETPPESTGDVSNVIAEEVVRQSSGEDDQGLKAFVQKMKDSYSLAQGNGFEGSFDEFLANLTQSITEKENEVVSNPLGTTDGSGDVVTPESEVPSEQAEVSGEVENTDDTLPEKPVDVPSEEATGEAAVTDDTTGEASEVPVEESTAPEGSDAPLDTEETTTPESSEEIVESTSENPAPEAGSEENPEEVPGKGAGESIEATPEVEFTEAPTEASEETPEEGSEEHSTDTNLNGEEVPDDAKEPTAEEVPEPAATDDESLNEYIDKVDDEQEEADDTAAMVEEAEDSSSRLGRIAEIVQDAVAEAKATGSEEDSEKVTESLAKIAEIANECYTTRFGIKPRYSIFVANEDLREALTPVQRCEVSLEAMGDTLKVIWEAILKAIEAAAEWFNDIWRKIQLNTGLMKKHLDNLQKVVDTSEESAGGVKMNSPRLWNNLAEDGIVKNQALEINRLTDVAKSVYSDMNDWVVETARTTTRLAYGFIGKPQEFKKSLKKASMPNFKGIQLQASENPVRDGIISLNQEESVSTLFATSGLFPGNMRFVMGLPNTPVEMNRASESDEHVLKGIAKAWGSKYVGVRFTKAENLSSKEDDVVLSLSTQEMKSILKSLNELLDSTKGFNQASSKIKSERTKIKQFVYSIRTTNFVMKAVPDKAVSGKMKMSKYSISIIANMLSNAARSLSEPISSFTSYCLKMMAVEMSYISQSLEVANPQATKEKEGSGASSFRGTPSPTLQLT